MPRSPRQVQPRSQRPPNRLLNPKASTPRPRPGRVKDKVKGRVKGKVRVRVKVKVRVRVRVRDKGNQARGADKAPPAPAEKCPGLNSRRSSGGTKR